MYPYCLGPALLEERTLTTGRPDISIQRFFFYILTIAHVKLKAIFVCNNGALIVMYVITRTNCISR